MSLYLSLVLSEVKFLTTLILCISVDLRIISVKYIFLGGAVGSKNFARENACKKVIKNIYQYYSKNDMVLTVLMNCEFLKRFLSD